MSSENPSAYHQACFPEKDSAAGSQLMQPGHIERLLWRLLAMLFVVLGAIGVLLPVVPTAPFLLAAAWAAGRGWPALELWLLRHPRYGEPIRQWRSGGVVSRRAKWGTTLMMDVAPFCCFGQKRPWH